MLRGGWEFATQCACARGEELVSVGPTVLYCRAFNFELVLWEMKAVELFCCIVVLSFTLASVLLLMIVTLVGHIYLSDSLKASTSAINILFCQS